jgi:succinoglycan biosynthesis transport protein ExoP
VKWGSTPQHLVMDAAKKLRAANVPLAGTVLTQVDIRRHKFYGRGTLPYHYAKTYYTA